MGMSTERRQLIEKQHTDKPIQVSSWVPTQAKESASKALGPHPPMNCGERPWAGSLSHRKGLKDGLTCKYWAKRRQIKCQDEMPKTTLRLYPFSLETDPSPYSQEVRQETDIKG